MKKKIRELTEEDIKKLCDNNYEKYGGCYGCPLETGEDGCLGYLDLDQEIEVNEDA
jgi:hypothetical protein